MKRFNVTYKGKAYQVNAGLRATFVFEQLADKSFEIKTTLDSVLYAYAIMWTSGEFTEQFDDFVLYCDENTSFINELFKAIPVLGNADAPEEVIPTGQN